MLGCWDAAGGLKLKFVRSKTIERQGESEAEERGKKAQIKRRAKT